MYQFLSLSMYIWMYVLKLDTDSRLKIMQWTPRVCFINPMVHFGLLLRYSQLAKCGVGQRPSVMSVFGKLPGTAGWPIYMELPPNPYIIGWSFVVMLFGSGGKKFEKMFDILLIQARCSYFRQVQSQGKVKSQYLYAWISIENGTELGFKVNWRFIQWNLSITTTLWYIFLPSGAHLGGQGPLRWAPESSNC